MEFSLLFAALMGVLGLYGLLWWEAKRGNAVDCSRSLWDISISAAVVGVFAGRIAAMIGDGVSPLDAPADILVVRAGVDTGFASLAAVITMLLLSGREWLLVADGLAAAALAGLGGWHAGCLARDACLGTASDLPWAFALEGSPIGRHPVELYAAGLFLFAAVAVASYKAFGRPPSLVPTGVALAAAGSIRLITEPLRASLTGGPEGWYAAAILIGVLATAYGLARRSVPADTASAADP